MKKVEEIQFNAQLGGVDFWTNAYGGRIAWNLKKLPELKRLSP